MSPPPPPPPPSSGEEMQHPQHASMYTTPPQRQTKSYGYGYSYGYMARRRTANAGTLDAPKSPAASPATSASSAASPSHLHKTKSASELISPRVRGRMDPYPRYSPRKRLSADFSDGTYSAGTESPKSEKGGWRIHAAVHGPFLTGPLAQEFVNDVLSPRGKKKEDQDFDDAGLLLFPVVPAYVAPAITPEVFQASIQPQPQAEQQPQPEPDHSVAAAPQNDACYYPESTYNQDQQPTETPVAEASWDASTQQQYYQEGHQEYYQGTAEEQQYYQSTAEHQQYYQATSEEQQYYQEQQAAYYYNNGGYDQQQYDAANYGYEQSYEQYPAASSEQPAPEAVAAVEPPTADDFPPLPHHEVAAVAEVTESVVVEQAAEPVPVTPPSPVQRPRAPSYAEIVTGAAHSSPRKEEMEASKAPRKVSFNAFDQLSEGIAESMTRMLAKSKDSKSSHAEVEFTCVIRRIQTQLKLMGKVTKNLHLEQVKTMHKLQKSEIEKLSMESANLQLQQQIKKYEEEQLELKQQLALALEAKDQRLKAAVDQLTQRIDVLKSSTDASTAKMASDIDAIRSSGSDDLEKRVKEIGDVLDYLVKNQTGEPSAKALARKNDAVAVRQSGGSWKSVAFYSLVACAASLSGVWVGINYADDIQHFGTTQPLALEETAVEAILSQITEDAPASYSSQIVEIIENEAVAEVSEVVAPEVVVAPIETAVEEIGEPVVEMEVAADLSNTAAVVDFIEAPAVSANWNTEEAAVVAPVTDLVVVEEAAAETAEEIPATEEPVAEVAEVEEVAVVDEVVEIIPEVVEVVPEVAEVVPEVVEAVPEVEEAVPEVVEAAAEVIEAAAEVVEVAPEAIEAADEVVEEVVEAVEDVVIPAEVAETEVAPVEETIPVEEASSPLNGLARALGSLSSSILTENAPVVAAEVEDVIAEEAPVEVEPVVEESSEEADDVSGSVIEMIDAEATVEVSNEVVEAVEVETVEAIEYSNSTASVSFETSLVEALSFAAVEEPVVAEIAAEVPVVEAVEAVEETARSRWAQEQFLVEVGASCGLEAEAVAEPVVIAVEEPAAWEVAAVQEPVEEAVSSEWFLEEQPVSQSQYSNVSAPVFVETEMIEKVAVTESAREESSLEMCSAPVFDLKTQLLTAL